MLLKNMGASVRIACGYKDRERFYTLDAESMNNRIKKKREQKRGGWSSTIATLQEVSRHDVNDIYEAIANVSTGLELAPKCRIYSRPDFFHLTVPERKEVFEKVKGYH